MITIDAKGKELAIGDVVQIIDETHHWFPVFLVVAELKGWGVMAYMTQVTSNRPEIANDSAYIRIKSKEIEHIGKAAIVLRSETEAIEAEPVELIDMTAPLDSEH